MAFIQTSLLANASVEMIINDKTEMITAVLFMTCLFHAIISIKNGFSPLQRQLIGLN
jgi:hypothetical protein